MSDQNPLFSKDPKQVVKGYFDLKKTIEDLEARRAVEGEIPGYEHREFSINRLPDPQSEPTTQPSLVKCVEYLTHGEVGKDLPRQIRLGYRPSNGYSETVLYHDQYWTEDGEVCYSVEFSVSKTGVLKRTADYSKDGEVVHHDITHVQIK